MRNLPGVVVLALVSAGYGCEVPRDVPDPDLLWINKIEVVGEQDGIGGGVLDVEVHLFDELTHEHLGCSSLTSVDVSGVAYDFEYFFQHNGRRVDPTDLFGRPVVIEVIEDDIGPCPEPPDPTDDPIGTSRPIVGDTLGTTGPLTFGNVPLLELNLYPCAVDSCERGGAR